MSLPTPPDLPVWGTAIDSGDIATPDAGTQAAGWIKVSGVPPKPPYQWMNWFQTLTYFMLKWCRDSILTLAGAQLVPAGTIVQFAGASAPTGWFLCDGSTKSQATYPELYAVLGTTYGTDTGGNFTLPDGRAKALVGYKSGDTGTVHLNKFDTLGESLGEKTHQLTVAELATHEHGITHFASSGANPSIDYSTGLTGSNTIDTAPNGSDDAHNNVQESLVINHIIKY